MAPLGLQNTGKSDCTKSECPSQVRGQQLSACKAGQGEALQSCLCSSTANVFYLHLTVFRYLVHTNICKRAVLILCPWGTRYQLTAPPSSAKLGLKFSLAESSHISLPTTCLRTHLIFSVGFSSWALSTETFLSTSWFLPGASFLF